MKLYWYKKDFHCYFKKFQPHCGIFSAFLAGAFVRQAYWKGNIPSTYSLSWCKCNENKTYQDTKYYIVSSVFDSIFYM